MSNLHVHAPAQIDGRLDVGDKIFIQGREVIPAPWSDRRLKDNIKVIDHALEKVLKLKGVEFTWKKDGIKDIGLIAQDVEQVFPSVVHTNEQTGFKSVNYMILVGPLVQAIKELKAEKDADIQALKAENQALRKDVEALKTNRK